MISEYFKQGANASSAYGNEGMGLTDIFISHNWDVEKMLATNYLGIHAGDVLYAQSNDKRLKFNNLKIRITAPSSPETQIGGLHAYTNDLVLPKDKEFYLKAVKPFYLSNKPFAETEDKTVTYTLPSGKIVETSPTEPPVWNEGETSIVTNPVIQNLDPNPGATTVSPTAEATEKKAVITSQPVVNNSGTKSEITTGLTDNAIENTSKSVVTANTNKSKIFSVIIILIIIFLIIKN